MTDCHPLIAPPMRVASGRARAPRGTTSAHAATPATPAVAGELPVLREFSARGRPAAPPLPRIHRNRFSCPPPAN